MSLHGLKLKLTHRPNGAQGLVAIPKGLREWDAPLRKLCRSSGIEYTLGRIGEQFLLNHCLRAYEIPIAELRRWIWDLLEGTPDIPETLPA